MPDSDGVAPTEDDFGQGPDALAPDTQGVVIPRPRSIAGYDDDMLGGADDVADAIGLAFVSYEVNDWCGLAVKLTS